MNNDTSILIKLYNDLLNVLLEQIEYIFNSNWWTIIKEKVLNILNMTKEKNKINDKRMSLNVVFPWVNINTEISDLNILWLLYIKNLWWEKKWIFDKWKETKMLYLRNIRLVNLYVTAFFEFIEENKQFFYSTETNAQFINKLNKIFWNDFIWMWFNNKKKAL